MSSLRDFDVLEELGEGGFGVVYLVRQRSSTDLYAMKVMGKKRLMRKKAVKRAIAEKQILEGLDHHFVVGLEFAFQTQSRLYLLLDFAARGTLAELQALQPGNRFSLAAARFCVAEIVVAIDYLHKQGIIYRDLKGDNACK